MIQLDGSYLEGGGQIIRTALALSALTGKSFEISDIRKGRCNQGLAHQHLECVKSVQQLCDAAVEGALLCSEKIKFVPKPIKAHNMKIDIGTAGSITLLLQALLLPCMFADKKMKITISGGTDVRWSQPFDYFNCVLIPHLRKFAYIDVKLIKRGYYPKGQGSVEITVTPLCKINDYQSISEFTQALRQQVAPLHYLEQGYLIQIKGISHASKELEHAQVAERQATSASLMLKKYGCPINIQNEYTDALSVGSGITLIAVYSLDKDEIDHGNPIRLGSDGLGERDKKAEIVGQEAAEHLMHEMDSKAPLDQYMGDQILPFLALVGGKVKISRITNHARTNIFVIEQFLGTHFEIDEKNSIISVQ
jgi:RNA 3'-phosphate cyclase